MTKLGRILGGAFLIAVAALSADVFADAKPKVLLIAREGYSSDLDLMIKMEIGVMKVLLKDANFDVDVATTSGMPIAGSTEKITDIKQLRTVKLDDYAGVIIACMAVGGSSQPYPAVSPEVVAIVRQALAAGKPVAANGNAAVVLAEAGVLKGRKYSFARDPLKPVGDVPMTFPAFRDATYAGSGLVQDGSIITSAICATQEKTRGRENGTVRLTQAFITAVKRA